MTLPDAAEIFDATAWDMLQVQHGESVIFTPSHEVPVPVNIASAIVDRTSMIDEQHEHFDHDLDQILVTATAAEFAGYQIGKSKIETVNGTFHLAGKESSLRELLTLRFSRTINRGAGRARSL